MKNRMKMAILVLIVTPFTFLSCKKYENGGSYGKAEKNIANTWVFEAYYQDGIDKTPDLIITNYQETYVDDGTLTRSFTDEDGDPISQVGTYSFADDKSRISLSGIGSIELTNETSTVSTSQYDILKLTDNELWYDYENGGNRHEFHLVPQ